MKKLILNLTLLIFIFHSETMSNSTLRIIYPNGRRGLINGKTIYWARMMGSRKRLSGRRRKRVSPQRTSGPLPGNGHPKKHSCPPAVLEMVWVQPAAMLLEQNGPDQWSVSLPCRDSANLESIWAISRWAHPLTAVFASRVMLRVESAVICRIQAWPFALSTICHRRLR